MSPRPPGLSVCCLTDNNPLMVAEALRPFRGVADEIVIAVDSWVDPSTLGPLAEIADTLVRFDFVHPPERARPWLVQLCRYQTVLMIDGDEVPSTALLEQLPTLVADPEPVQFRLGRRWCFPDERSWLGERPWWPDYQLRMVRQGPLLDFDLRVHGGVRPALPARYVDEPLYHLVHPLIPFAQRRARVRVYAADRPGLVAVGGGPMNDTLYVPEHFATLRPRPTPPEDLLLLRRVMEAARLEPDFGGPAVNVPVVTTAEIAEHIPVDGMAAQGYAATVRVAELDCRTEPGNDTLIAVEVTNTGTLAIPRLDSAGVQVRVATRLVDTRSLTPEFDWTMTTLPCDIPGGETRLAEVLVRIPDRNGTFWLEVDLINERGRWFGSAVREKMLVTSRWGRYASDTV